MRSRKVVQALMITGAAVAVCAVAVSAAAAAAPAAATGPVAIVCPTGDMCLQPISGATVLVRSGQSRSFSPPLKVTVIENRTALSYCVEVGLIVFDRVPSNGIVSGTHTVREVMPGPVCPG